MLCLTRAKNETIVIGNGLVKVTVLRIGWGKVMLGIEAPKDLAVHRSEVEEAIQRQQAIARSGAGECG